LVDPVDVGSDTGEADGEAAEARLNVQEGEDAHDRFVVLAHHCAAGVALLNQNPNILEYFYAFGYIRT
jgi:hypothetical protein